MTTMTAHVPGITVSDDAADALVGQVAPFTVGGLPVGEVKVTGAHVTLDGLNLDLELPAGPALDALAASFTFCTRAVSLVVATHTVDDAPVLELDRIAYPADRPEDD